MTVAAVAGAGIGVAAFVTMKSSPGTGTPSFDRTQAGDTTAGSPPASRSRPQASPGPSASSGVDPAAVAALRPRRLTVVADDGSAVTLRWALPASAKIYPLILQQGPGSAKVATPLGKEATSARVVGLDPAKGYCFRVGVVLEINTSSTIAWSPPRCMRGAIARPAGGFVASKDATRTPSTG
jgi:hypothetical protein